MSLPIEIITPIIIIAVIIVIPVTVVALLNRGKKLKCPDCEHVFKAPLMDEKMLGVGWTLPYIGRVRCSHCGASHSRKNYTKVVEQ